MLELLFSALPELIAVTPVLLIGLLPSALLVMLALSMGNTTQIRRAVRAMGEGCDPEPLLTLSMKTLKRYGGSRNPGTGTSSFPPTSTPPPPFITWAGFRRRWLIWTGRGWRGIPSPLRRYAF